MPPFYCYRACDVKRIQEALNNGCGYDAPGSFAAWLSKQTPMHAYVMPGKRYDIGDINSYEYMHRVSVFLKFRMSKKAALRKDLMDFQDYLAERIRDANLLKNLQEKNANTCAIRFSYCLLSNGKAKSARFRKSIS